MNQKKTVIPEQVLYLDRWVNKCHFAAFVYNDNGEKRLAKTYDEFETLVASGLWKDRKPGESTTTLNMPDEPSKEIFSRKRGRNELKNSTLMGG